ncbi:MFS transporter [Clostridium perfringens]|nr:MFS transporter [Clostridium perfringens]
MDRFKSIKNYASFPRNVQIIVISELILAGAFGIYGFLQILYLNEIKIPPDKIGILFSIGALSSMVGFFVGPFINILGRKTVLTAGCLLSALGMGFYVVFISYFMLLIAQILVNIGLCFIQVTELQLLYSYTTPDKECCAYSYKSSVNFIASTLGGLLAGNINKIPIFINVSYKILFLLATMMTIGAFIIRLFLLPKDKRIKSDSKVVNKALKNALTLFKTHKRIRVFAMFLFILSVGGSAIWPYNNLILKNQFNLNNTIISIINFIITSLNMVSITLMPMVIEKLGIRKFELLAMLGIVLSTFFLSLGLPTVIFIVALICRAASACLVGSSLDSSMMSHIELENRDIFAGVKLLVNGLSSSIGNFIGGLIIDKLTYRGIYVYGFVLMIITTLVFYLKVTKYFDEEIHIKMLKERHCKCHMRYTYVQRKI